MGPKLCVLIMFIAVFSVAQGLMCNYCVDIKKDHPCEAPREIECSVNLTQCIRIVMDGVAYGEVRRCASTKECEADVHGMVLKECCDTDFCN